VNAALLVIDMQRALLDEPPGAFEAGLVIERINVLAFLRTSL